MCLYGPLRPRAPGSSGRGAGVGGMLSGKRVWCESINRALRQKRVRLGQGIRSSFLIALEVLADLDVGISLYAPCIFSDELEIGSQHPTIGQICVEEVVVLVGIAAQVEEHWKLRFDESTLYGGRQCVVCVAEDRLVNLPLDRHQLAVRAEEHVAVTAGRIALPKHEG